jgi:hypothetical protein
VSDLSRHEHISKNRFRLVHDEGPGRHSPWLRRQFHIENGTKAVVQATREGILLKPVTAATIRRLRGSLKRKPGDKSFDQDWAEHKREAKELEEAKYAPQHRFSIVMRCSSGSHD